MSWASVVEDAETGAAILMEQGVGPGDRVGLLGPNHPLWAAWAHAIWRLGAILVPLGYPLRIRDRDAVREHLGLLLASAECALVLAPDTMLDLADAPSMDWAALRDGPLARGITLPEPPDPDDTAILQYTSGSTTLSRGAAISHFSAVTACTLLQERYRLTSSDRWLGWTPLFHDLGLITTLALPVVVDLDCQLLPTERFAKNPALWLRMTADTGSTITTGPTSAMAVTLRLLSKHVKATDLSALRVLMLTAEAVEPDVVDQLATMEPAFGLRPTAVHASYGLAENTLAATAGKLAEPVRILELDATALARDGKAVDAISGPVRRLVSCGAPLTGMDVRIAAAGSTEAANDRVVGEILIKGPTPMQGYRGEFEQPFQDGFLRTGDLGFLDAGELFVVGRIKELVIVQGRNYAPEEIEWAASRADGVRRCVAFARPEHEGQIVLVVELAGAVAPEAAVLLARNAVTNTLGLALRDVVVVPPGTITRTTSGKLRRTALREAFLRGSLEVLPGSSTTPI